MKAELLTEFSFLADHTLDDYEIRHGHLWKLKVALFGKIQEGRIIDVVLLRNRIEELIQPLKDTYLNQNESVTPEVRRSPTCETLGVFFYDELEKVIRKEFIQMNSTLRISSVAITICSVEGVEMGSVRILPE